MLGTGGVLGGAAARPHRLAGGVHGPAERPAGGEGVRHARVIRPGQRPASRRSRPRTASASASAPSAFRIGRGFSPGTATATGSPVASAGAHARHGAGAGEVPLGARVDEGGARERS
ncbi:hypothetical protein [Streptomyces sp. YKOK-J1]